MVLNIEQTLFNLFLAALFSILGFLLLYLGYRVFDWLTAADIRQKIFEEGNVAAGIFMGAFIIAIAVVIAASIHG